MVGVVTGGGIGRATYWRAVGIEFKTGQQFGQRVAEVED